MDSFVIDGGLFSMQCYEDGWNLTHVPTGYNAATGLTSGFHAIAAASVLIRYARQNPGPKYDSADPVEARNAWSKDVVKRMKAVGDCPSLLLRDGTELPMISGKRPFTNGKCKRRIIFDDT